MYILGKPNHPRCASQEAFCSFWPKSLKLTSPKKAQKRLNYVLFNCFVHLLHLFPFCWHTGDNVRLSDVVKLALKLGLFQHKYCHPAAVPRKRLKPMISVGTSFYRFLKSAAEKTPANDLCLHKLSPVPQVCHGKDSSQWSLRAQALTGSSSLKKSITGKRATRMFQFFVLFSCGWRLCTLLKVEQCLIKSSLVLVIIIMYIWRGNFYNYKGHTQNKSFFFFIAHSKFVDRTFGIGVARVVESQVTVDLGIAPSFQILCKTIIVNGFPSKTFCIMLPFWEDGFGIAHIFMSLWLINCWRHAHEYRLMNIMNRILYNIMRMSWSIVVSLRKGMTHTRRGFFFTKKIST